MVRVVFTSAFSVEFRLRDRACSSKAMISNTLASCSELSSREVSSLLDEDALPESNDEERKFGRVSVLTTSLRGIGFTEMRIAFFGIRR